MGIIRNIIEAQPLPHNAVSAYSDVLPTGAMKTLETMRQKWTGKTVGRVAVRPTDGYSWFDAENAVIGQPRFEMNVVLVERPDLGFRQYEMTERPRMVFTVIIDGQEYETIAAMLDYDYHD